MENKIFKSIDGLFEESLKYYKIKNIRDISQKRISIIGKGNSISSLPYKKGSMLIDLSLEDNIKFDKFKKVVEVTGNIEVFKIHNFLLNNKFFFPSFPSYPLVTVGACIANCTHGISPKFGVIKDYIKEIKIYNPNFGIKKLSKTQNKKLFNLTVGGMGLTGIIISAKLKVFKLKGSFIRISENKKFDNFEDVYNFLKKNNYIYNQNNLFLQFKKNKFVVSRISSGDFVKNKYKHKLLNIKKISGIRLGVLKFDFFRKLLEKILLIKEYANNQKLIHINDAFFPSNSRLIYFNLMPKKFMENQVIIPHKNVRAFFKNFEKLCAKYSPIITLCHLKIFNGKGEYLQFNGKGLGLTIHYIIDKNFHKFYESFLDLSEYYKCKPNLYKNSIIRFKDIKKFYKKDYINFCKEIKKLNKKSFFENRLFNLETFYK
jgi:FAD/FMN-containing dehydrogenase